MDRETLRQLTSELREKLELVKGCVPGLAGLDRGFGNRGAVAGEVVLRVFVRAEGSRGAAASRADLARLAHLAPLVGEPVEVIDLAGPEAGQDVPPQGTAGCLEAMRRCNPIRPGLGVSRHGQGSGTLGLVAYRPAGEPVALSCAHVLAGPFARRDDPVFQPGLQDGGNPDFDAIGYLADWFVDGDGDAAYAELNRTRMLGLEQLATRQVVRRAGAVRLGELLAKTGRGTGSTTARVDGIGLYRLALSRTKEVWMAGFRLVPEGDGKGEISGPGDSGAVWVRGGGAAGEGVGLHVDGEGALAGRPGYAVACHLPVVLERFGLALSPPEPARPVSAETSAPFAPFPSVAAVPPSAPAAGWSESAWRVADWVRRHPVETAELADVLAGMAREGAAAELRGL